jgi:hypothetical protein
MTAAALGRLTRILEPETQGGRCDGPAASAALLCVGPATWVAFVYVMNGMGMQLVDDPRKMALLGAVMTASARHPRVRDSRCG